MKKNEFEKELLAIVKEELKDYITNPYLTNDLDEKYILNFGVQNNKINTPYIVYLY